MLPPRSQIAQLSRPGGFVWATGVEDTVITQPWPATGRILDEYLLTGHDRRWRSDLDLIARLGVRAVRYGIPWHRVQTTPRRWEWDWAERRIDRLLALGLEPIVDLVHYGLPPWLAGAWLAPDLPERLAEFAALMAERLRGRVRWYTPVNEPRITAWYCGRLGWWPPNHRGWAGFVAVMLAIARGVSSTVAALRAVDPEMVDVHVEATDVYASTGPGLDRELALRRRLAFLAMDLITGRVTPHHPLFHWLLAHGANDRQLATIHQHAVAEPGLIGLNLYPLFSRKVLSRSEHGLRVRMPYAPATILSTIARAYWHRYRRPLMITETASSGSHRRRLAWLDNSLAVVRQLRAAGVPLVGYTWWPLFAIVAWAYRQGRQPPGAYLRQMGLWDLRSDLSRITTPVVEAFAAAVAVGDARIGALRTPQSGT